MNIEEWKPVKNYEGLYEVSNFGNIRRVGKTSNRKLNISRYGYALVNLYKNNVSKNLSVHRLVAEVFVPNVEAKPQINHIDGNKLNNNVNNLEWCTAKENILHTFRVLNRKGVSNKKKKLGESYRAKPVNQYDLNNNFIRRWSCIKEATAKLKISNGMISKCCNKRRKTAGGYIWKFVD